MAATISLTKFLFLNAQTCPTLAWLQAHESPGQAGPTLAEQFRMQEGAEVGELARNAFPGGKMVASRQTEDAVAETAKLVADASVTVIFEAAFLVDGIVARADVICREAIGWKLYEVKSSLNDSDELVADLAYTTMVLSRAGLKVTKASLLLLSRLYRLGDPVSTLFVEIDHSSDVFPLASTFSKAATLYVGMLNQSQPKPELIRACRDCPYFESQCLGKAIEHHLLTLPRLLEKRFTDLTGAGYRQISDIPASAKLSDAQRIVREAVVTGAPVMDKGSLKTLLSGVQWPAGYLDFETFKTAVPLYPDIAPHEQVVTQYSLHVCSSPGAVTSHHEFLADPSKDSRRELAEQLLAHLSAVKSIIVYSGFEKRVLSELAALFPDLGKDLQSCIGRLFDLEAAVKPGVYYHPEFRGRSSIKATFPVLVPTMSYADLTVQDGDTAIAQFAMMARKELAGDEAKRVRRELLDYCKRDTLAMVELHRALETLVTGP